MDQAAERARQERARMVAAGIIDEDGNLLAGDQREAAPTAATTDDSKRW